jgi:nucleolar protein 53
MSGIKKKRVSKKNKISWRKHVNISDVEEFLEDKRLEERLGPPLATLTNEELFKIETKPSEDLSLKQQKKLKLLKPPRCFELLQPHTQVPDPIKKRNRVRSKEERKNDLIKKKEAENRAKGILKHREVQAINDRQVYETKKKCAPKRGEFTENIWNDDGGNEKNEWLASNTIKHNLVGSGKSSKTVKRPAKHETSVLPSIEAPHPGMSYNPSFDDHQDLLKAIADKELKIIKEEKHLNRVTKGMFSKVTVDQKESAWLNEMSQGLPQQSTQDIDTDSDEEYKAINPPTKNIKKTLQQRRKQKEQMKLDLLRRAAKIEKKKVTDIHQLKTLNKVIQKNENKMKILKEKRKKIQLLKKKEPKRLSAIKFEESELEFNMGPDISGNLRNLKKEGSLLGDRFKSFQKRNIIVPSVRRHRQKSKVKIYTKPGHKEDWISTVAR